MEDTLKDFWATRPRRPRRGRKIAGVAAGIGNRYAIDPVIVRVGFVVATIFGGVGGLLYLLGWLFLPEQDDEAAPFDAMIHHRRSSTSSAFTVLLCLALIPALWFFVDNQFGGILALLIVVGAVYLLHRHRGHLGRPTPSQPAASTGTFTEPPPYVPFAPPTPASASSRAEPETETPAPATPPAWDPLGAAPFAWDLPEPSPPAPEPPKPRRKSKAGLITFAALLITGGTLLAAAPYTSWLTPPHIVGLMLGVLGLGMVGASFVRGGRGLIWLAVPLSMVGIGLTAIGSDGWHGVGEINDAPTRIADVQHDYRRSAGHIDLDLTKLPASGEVETEIRVDTGDILVTVPRDADVEIRCEASLGDVDCLGEQQSGTDVEFTRHDNGEDGPGGLQISLTASAGAGHVEVRRG